MRLARLPLILLGVAGLIMACFTIASRLNNATPMNSRDANFNPVLIRTDFSDEGAWRTIRAGVLEIPLELRQHIQAMRAINEAAGVDVSGYDRPVEFVNIIDDPQYAESTMDEVLELVEKDSNDACIFVVDQHAISNPDHPVLVIDLWRQRGRMFRAIPSEVGGIASNLSIANMDWEDFADDVDPDGVFRGFPRSAP